MSFRHDYRHMFSLFAIAAAIFDFFAAAGDFSADVAFADSIRYATPADFR